jgi:hypothetical protein
VATVDYCTSCDGSTQHSGQINNTYDVPWQVEVRNDQVCVEVENAGETNASINLWVEDDQAFTAISDPAHWVQVPPATKVSQLFTGFGYQADQVTPVDSCNLHTAVYNEDDPTQSVYLHVAVR